jgi:pimeloyl-ACP methyl ester carboxylesterase
MSSRGHRASEGEENIGHWMRGDYADDVTGVIDRIGRPVVVIAHSLGEIVRLGTSCCVLENPRSRLDA